MKKDFAKCLLPVLRYEGGWSNNRRDPGGVTLNGIIQRVDDAWRRNRGQPPRPLTPSMNGDALWNVERNAIYRAQYWDAVRGDELPDGVALVMFDAAVNSGPFQSVKWLQCSLAAAGLYHDQVDGHFGEGTIDALSRHSDHGALVSELCSRRLGMLQHLSTWSTFGAGWTSRIVNLKAIALAWVADEHASAPAPVAAHEDGGNSKAYASDVAQPAVDAQAATIGSVGSGSISGVLQGAQSSIEPVMHTSEILHQIYVGLTLAGVVIAICGMGYAAWASFKTSRARRAIDGSIMANVPEGQPA